MGIHTPILTWNIIAPSPDPADHDQASTMPRGPLNTDDSNSPTAARRGGMGAIARPALFGLLEQAARVTVVSAPAGSGKTVLLRSWIEETGLKERAAWLSIGRNERDVQKFWTGVVEALRATVRGSQLLRVLEPAPSFDGWATVERLLEDLAALDEQLWLVKPSSKIAALIACLPLSALAQSLQCGESVITNGTTQAEVAARCGPPAQIEHQTIYGESAAAVPPVGVLPPIGLRSTTEIPIEVWTYNFGPNRLMERIRFENGVVVRIESLGYGF
jgi:Protein of unknown function (DUF2845)